MSRLMDSIAGLRTTLNTSAQKSACDYQMRAVLELEAACDGLLDYWRRNGSMNWQLEKAEDHFRKIAKARDDGE